MAVFDIQLTAHHIRNSKHVSENFLMVVADAGSVCCVLSWERRDYVSAPLLICLMTNLKVGETRIARGAKCGFIAREFADMGAGARQIR
jgi:hypothetical protein